jgi:hypothetical protein
MFTVTAPYSRATDKAGSEPPCPWYSQGAAYELINKHGLFVRAIGKWPVCVATEKPPFTFQLQARPDCTQLACAAAHLPSARGEKRGEKRAGGRRILATLAAPAAAWPEPGQSACLPLPLLAGLSRGLHILNAARA